jgi:Golgi nucleoside diphosphatase
MKKLTNSWVLFLTAGIAVIKKFPKNDSAHVNGTPNVAVDFRRNLRKIVKTSGFWKPCNMVTSNFRNLFYDCTTL